MKSDKKQLRQGVVISSNNEKFVIVEVQRKRKHRIYNKVINIKRKYYAHDPSGDCKENDTVIIEQSRPLSKMKRWKVISKTS